MIANPYAPPAAMVADVRSDADTTPARSSLTRAIVWVPAVLGAIAFMFVVVGAFVVVSRSARDAMIIVLGVYAVMSMGAAVGIYRHLRSIAILWFVVCAAMMLLPLTRTKPLDMAQMVLIFYLALQLIAAVLGVWTTVRWRKNIQMSPIG